MFIYSVILSPDVIGTKNLLLEVMKTYSVYLMANRSRTLYTGVTGNLHRRVYQHKHNLIKGFTSKYQLKKLVYYECCYSPQTAIAREKQVKGWLRQKKIALVESVNPEWKDLAENWFD